MAGACMHMLRWTMARLLSGLVSLLPFLKGPKGAPKGRKGLYRCGTEAAGDAVVEDGPDETPNTRAGM